MTITISIDENATTTDINLDAAIDPNDSSALVVCYDGQSLDSTQNLLVDCLVGQEVRFVVTDFTDAAGLSWTLNASPLVRANSGTPGWRRNGSTALDAAAIAWPHGSSYVDVDVEGAAQSGGQTKKRRRIIQVKMQTSNPGPGGGLE